jgi:hypothetical protein
MKRKMAIFFGVILATFCLCFAPGLSAQSFHLGPPAGSAAQAPMFTPSGCGYLKGTIPAAPTPAAAQPVAPARPSSRFDVGTATPRLVLTSATQIHELRTIVGMWSFQFVSEGTDGIPDGTVIDHGYATWHVDGTEIMNSGGRPPVTGNFCMGVWKAAGLFSYKLNHFGLSWDPAGATFIGPANIRENVTLDRSGDSYSGTFTIDQYDTNGNVLAHLQGNVTATRVTPD